jgi:pimeloyl-ACP methyl ester carboxylesterase
VRILQRIIRKQNLKVYFISGIGADYRLFSHLQLPEGYTASYIHWIPPNDKEKLKDYALRLAGQIDTAEPFILAGLSLGGIMAVEIAKQFPPLCTILISSVPLSAHLPKYFKLAHRLQLNKLVPASLLKTASTIKHSLTMRSPANRKLMREVIRSGDDRFITWAMNAVLEWDNATIPQPFYHIHGTRDEVFPISLTKPTHVVPNGGHMFLVDRPEAVNAILREIIGSLQAS